MSDLGSPFGLALRRSGGCLSTETDCGQTWAPFHACCPGGTFCPAGQDNVHCCPSEANCDQLINKHCANATANVYHAAGYFCCAEGQHAFERPDSFVGCTNDIADLGQSMTLLSVAYYGSTSTPTTTSTTTSSTTTPSNSDATTTSDTSTSSSTTKNVSPVQQTPAPDTMKSASSSSSSHTGAIVGGVIGGVAAVVILAGLIWFFKRRNRGRRQQKEEPVMIGSGSEMTETRAPVELDANPGGPRYELPSTMETKG